MASWSKDRVEPNAINGGREFTRDDNLALNELNAIVNNSFYASEKSAEALGKINDIIEHEQGTVVTINDSPQAEWKADFVESERQKSKNLVDLSNIYQKSWAAKGTYAEPTLTVKNTSTSTERQWVAFKFKVKPGKEYVISGNSEIISGTDKLITIFNTGINEQLKSSTTLPFVWQAPNNNITEYLLIFYSTGETTYSNIQLEEGSQATEYQTYNGAIVHEKELLAKEIIYDNHYKINITTSTLTTLGEYLDLFSKDKTQTYEANIGNDDGTTNNFRTLVGNPFNALYTRCLIKHFCYGNRENGLRETVQLTAFNIYSSQIAIGYIWRNQNSVVNFTGWQVIGG